MREGPLSARRSGGGRFDLACGIQQDNHNSVADKAVEESMRLRLPIGLSRVNPIYVHFIAERREGAGGLGST